MHGKNELHKLINKIFRNCCKLKYDCTVKMNCTNSLIKSSERKLIINNSTVPILMKPSNSLASNAIWLKELISTATATKPTKMITYVCALNLSSRITILTNIFWWSTFLWERFHDQFEINFNCILLEDSIYCFYISTKKLTLAIETEQRDAEYIAEIRKRKRHL